MTARKRKRGRRRCVGRPRQLEGRTAICATLDRATLARLDTWAEVLGVSRSEALRYLIQQSTQPRSTSK